jgi:hypothetical protein
VVEQIEDYFKQTSVRDAQKRDPNAKVGDFVVDPLPPIEADHCCDSLGQAADWIVARAACELSS